MSGAKRALHIFTGIMMAISSIIMALFPEWGYQVVALILAVSLIVKGIHELSYYFSMARHMVGGLYVLYKGIFMLDIGLFAFGLDSLPRIFTLAYLVFHFGFESVVSILRAIDAKRLRAPWQYLLFKGILLLWIVIMCITSIGSNDDLTIIFSFGMMYTAIDRIVTAFKKTAIVYVDAPS